MKKLTALLLTGAENMTLKFTLKGFLEEQKGIAIGIDFGRGDSKQVENHIPYID